MKVVLLLSLFTIIAGTLVANDDNKSDTLALELTACVEQQIVEYVKTLGTARSGSQLSRQTIIDFFVNVKHVVIKNPAEVKIYNSVLDELVEVLPHTQEVEVLRLDPYVEKDIQQFLGGKPLAQASRNDLVNFLVHQYKFSPDKAQSTRFVNTLGREKFEVLPPL